MLAIEAKISVNTKGMQKSAFNFAKKTRNFVDFVNRKQKTKTNLDSN